MFFFFSSLNTWITSLDFFYKSQLEDIFVSIDIRIIFNYLKYIIRNQTILFGSIRLLK
jgi:hypothetical protein